MKKIKKSKLKIEYSPNVEMIILNSKNYYHDHTLEGRASKEEDEMIENLFGEKKK